MDINNLSDKTIDLHMHTTKSDGTDTPAEIVAAVKNKRISVFAITDHDTIAGCKEVREQELLEDILFINGVEFSTRDEKGKYHILGYAYDENAEAINSLVMRGHEIRMKKLFGRLDFLKQEFQIKFSDEEIEQLAALNNPGKPHIGKLMVEHGYASSTQEAISKYINKRKVKEDYVRPEEAIEAILKSGGVPVLAHPTYGDGSQLIIGKDMDARLKDLIGYGLQGVEAYYSEFTPKMQNEILGFAEKYDLYVTAGSDYHGENKMIELGDNNLEKVADGPKGLRDFLSRVL